MAETDLEEDVEVQKGSSGFIKDIDSALSTLFPSSISALGSQASPKQSHQHLERETCRATRAIDEFQGWPQLLDPHLAKSVSRVRTALVQFIQHPKQVRSNHESHPGFTRLHAACRILYTLCKVRGYKVIVQLLSQEHDHELLEPILYALKIWTVSLHVNGDAAWSAVFGWEERYILLLWLSQLMLAPHDLASIASLEFAYSSKDLETPMVLPVDVPDIARNLLMLSDRYIHVSGKERESATLLLTRLVLRPDMQRLGLDKVAIDWARAIILACINGDRKTDYTLVGILSFFAGFAKRADDRTLTWAMQPILDCIQGLIQESQDPQADTTIKSAVVRKLSIKTYRIIAEDALRMRTVSSDELVNEAFDYFYSILNDTDTTVRLAASKAIGIITKSFDTQNKLYLLKSFIWEDFDSSFKWRPFMNLLSSYQDLNTLERGVLEMHQYGDNTTWWHGTTMTIGHMLYQRSIPTSWLHSTVIMLAAALRYNRVTPLGAATGSNVRDAACYGLWALARKYSTKDLYSVQDGDVTIKPGSVVSIIATQLVQAACYDLVGNIRRGASAALQELIGRHSDAVDSGIDLVQIVTYDAVASDRKAMMQVALRVSRISLEPYWRTIAGGLLGWRGTQSHDENVRLRAAQSLGYVSVNSHAQTEEIHLLLNDLLTSMPEKEDAKRHGILNAVACVVKMCHQTMNSCDSLDMSRDPKDILSEPSFQVAHVNGNPHAPDVWKSLASYTSPIPNKRLFYQSICNVIEAFCDATRYDMIWWIRQPRRPDDREFDSFLDLANRAMRHSDPQVQAAAAQAGRALLALLPKESRGPVLNSWITEIQKVKPEQRTSARLSGFIQGLGAVFPLLEDHHPPGNGLESRDRMIEALVGLTLEGHQTEIKCVALRSIRTGPLDADVFQKSIFEAMVNCLNDYTNDSRLGDIGSEVRMEAITTATFALRRIPALRTKADQAVRNLLMYRICSLATESLDKVRFRAATCLGEIWNDLGLSRIASCPNVQGIIDTKTDEYFATFLRISSSCPEGRQILTGYVTSAGGTAAESLVATTRATLSNHMGDSYNEFSSIVRTLKNIAGPKTSDRVRVPAMEVLGFIYDHNYAMAQRPNASSHEAHTIDPLSHSFLHSLFADTTAFHHRSTDARKLEAALGIYTALLAAGDDVIRKAVLNKLCNMLGSLPVARIRNQIADILYLELGEEEGKGMLGVNWGMSVKDEGMRKAVEGLRGALRLKT